MRAAAARSAGLGPMCPQTTLGLSGGHGTANMGHPPQRPRVAAASAVAAAAPHRRRGPLAPLRRLRPARVLSAVVTTWQNIRPRINRAEVQRRRAERQRCRVAERDAVAAATATAGDPAFLSMQACGKAAAMAGAATPSASLPTVSYMSDDEEFRVADDTVHPVLRESTRLEALRRMLDAQPSVHARVMALRSIDCVDTFVRAQSNEMVSRAIDAMPIHDQYSLLLLPALGQEHVLASTSEEPTYTAVSDRLSKLAQMLGRVELFYDSIGGIVGYQLKSLQLIVAGMEELRSHQDASMGAGTGVGAEEAAPRAAACGAPEDPPKRFLVPKAVDLAAEDGREVARAATLRGLAAMPRLAEIYPVGGAGDRLGLVDEATGECLPAAMLPYCGRTMLEGLMRDLQAREYLYYRLTGTQLTTPVAIMTSDAKGNHGRIAGLIQRCGWFGRGSGAFRLFRQPMVPVMSVERGEWLLSGEMAPMMKPGGHGAIWKLMRDEGVFTWLEGQGREAALVRQISNPMAGMDTTLLALAGEGDARAASFGFMSCDRHVGAAEGVNVLQEVRVPVVAPDGSPSHAYEYNLTNVEYTEFDRLGITDAAAEGAPGAARLSVFPANTNVLYVGLPAASGIVDDAVRSGSSERLMPGLIFNLKKKVAYTDPRSGAQRSVQAGRMECTMQNIADFMVDRFEARMSPAEASAAQLSTFLVYNHRRKVTSSAKKRREPGSLKISQTPDGSFYDLQRNAWHLLQQCGVQVLPELGSVEQYLEKGPGFLALFHPALGPVWEVIAQKLVGGALHQGSELVLEVAEAALRNVDVRGSLLVRAERIVGQHISCGRAGADAGPRVGAEAAAPEGDTPAGAEHTCADGRLEFCEHVGRVQLRNVKVRNAGVDWRNASNVYWKHEVSRREALRVELLGASEFEAADVTISGDHTFVVPDGYRMVVSQAAGGGIATELLPLRGGRPTWEWRYSVGDGGAIELEYVRSDGGDVCGSGASTPAVPATAAARVRPAGASAGASTLTASAISMSMMDLSPLLMDMAGATEETERVLDYIIQDVGSWIV